MPNALDQTFDAVLARVIGPGGPVQIGEDREGRAVVTNFPATLPAMFDAFCAMNAACEIVADGERIGFAEMNAMSTRVARALVGGFGIRKGDRVAIAMRNAPAWIAAYMGIAKAGGIAVLVNGWWQPDEMRHGIALTAPALVIADAPRAARVEAAGGRAEIVTLPIEKRLEEALAPILSRDGEDATLPDVQPEDDATILFTSGSTGAAKGAVSTHRAVTSGTYAYTLGLATLKGIKESRGDPIPPPRILINVPLFHVTGMVPVFLNSFVVGRSMILMAKWDAGEALRLMAEEKVTYFVGVPTMSLELMQHPDRDKYDLSSLSDIAAGGAPRPIAHVKRLQDSFRHAQPALGYGLTETNAAGCSNFWQSYADKPTSTGRPQKPIIEVAILGEDGRHLSTGERGEIGIRAACNIRGYWNDEASTKAAFTADGFFRTGDIGYLDEEDYLFIVDRKKDIIIRGGENIACQEVESACYAHPGVSEAAVFGIADERLGEVPAAVVYSEAGSISEEELCLFLKERLAAFKVPAHLWVLDEPLPKLGTGKIDKLSLRETYRHKVAEHA